MSRSREEIQASIDSNRQILSIFEQSLKDLEQKKKDAQAKIITYKSENGSSEFTIHGEFSGGIIGQNVENVTIINNGVVSKSPDQIDREIKELTKMIDLYKQKIADSQKLLDQMKGE